MRRIVSLWLPLFATDRLTRPGKRLEPLRDRPLATVLRSGTRATVAAANAPARAAGIVPGMAAADASALCPSLTTVPAETEADAAALAALAEWCRRWSPWTAPGMEPEDDGLWIDSTGCAHLFGGERPMLDDMVGALERLGFAVRAALADTPGAAWAAARFGGERAMIVPEGAARQLLAGYPVAALRLPADTVATLRRLGVRRLGDLMALPRAPLVARFGAITAKRIDQLLGHLPEPLSPRLPEEPLFARLAFAEPIGRTEDVAAVLMRLLTVLAKQMEKRGLGARLLVLRLFRVDGSTLARNVGTNAPVRAPAHLSRLFAEGLDGLDAGFGIESMTLAVPAADPMAATQTDLERQPEGAALPLLADRLARRLGPAAAWRPVSRPTHVPERLCARAAPLTDTTGPWPPRPRPVRLMPRPEPIRVAEAAGRPERLHRHGDTLAVLRADGPERIAAEWWLGAAAPPAAAYRDYWRIEDERGRRWWIFRDGGDGRWYLHGTFA